MQTHHIYYLTQAQEADRQDSCELAGYTITPLPINMKGRLRERLLSGKGLGEKLFRFLFLRRIVKGKPLVVVSGRLQEKLPRRMWYANMEEDFPRSLYEAYAMESLADIALPLQQSRRPTALLAILHPDGVTQELLEELLGYAGEMKDLILYSFDEDEKEWLEDKLEYFLEDTGVAGMCYQMSGDKWQNPLRKPLEQTKSQEEIVLIDFAGRPLRELWGIDYYIDAVGKRSRKEIRKLKDRKTRVRALRNYLDRAFYTTL